MASTNESSEQEILSPMDLLFHLETWLTNKLGHLEHRGYSDPSGHPHGGAGTYIPEWELRAKRDEIRLTINDNPMTKAVNGGDQIAAR